MDDIPYRTLYNYKVHGSVSKSLFHPPVGLKVLSDTAQNQFAPWIPVRGRCWFIFCHRRLSGISSSDYYG
jgi:hypothetical protein